MSNFTTFFPSGGSGGGGINSYAPFKVSSLTGNPAGYNPTTGLYTNPIDSSVWLKTGGTIEDGAGNYPSATSQTDWSFTQLVSLSSTATGTNPTQKMIAGTAFNSDKSAMYVVFGAYSASSAANSVLLYKFNTTTGVQIGTEIDLTADWTVSAQITPIKGCIGLVGGTELFISGRSAGGVDGVTGYNPDTGAITTAHAARNQSTIMLNTSTQTYLNTSTTYWGADASSNLREVDTTTWTRTGNVIAAGSNSYGVAYDGTSFWSQTGLSGSWVELDGVGGVTGNVITNSANFNGGFSSSTNLLAGKYSSGFAGINQFTGVIKVGDSTARTDASGSGQPLFIKLK
jgi:hypothetical protein